MKSQIIYVSHIEKFFRKTLSGIRKNAEKLELGEGGRNLANFSLANGRGVTREKSGNQVKQLVEQIIVGDDGIEVHFKCGIVASHEYM